MRHARGQPPDGHQLLVLHHALLGFDFLGDIPGQFNDALYFIIFLKRIAGDGVIQFLFVFIQVDMGRSGGLPGLKGFG